MKKALGLLVILVLGTAIYYSSSTPEPAEEELIFADASKVWWTAPTIVAKSEGFFQKNGLKVKAFDVNTGLASKNAVLSGSADVGLVASTPLAIGATKNEQLLVLGKYVSSRHLLSILSELDIDRSPCIQNNQQCDELVKQLTMVYVPGTISEFYLIKYLQKHNQLTLLSLLKKHSLKLAPPAIPSSFGSSVEDRRINMTVIWEPLASEIRKPRSNPKNLYSLVQKQPDPELYELALYLVTTPEVWKQKRSAVLKFVSSVAQAGQFIKDNSDFVREKLEKKYNYPTGWLEDKWKQVDFNYDSSSDEIKRLIIEDADLAMMTKAIDKKPKVDYMLDVLDDVGNFLEGDK